MTHFWKLLLDIETIQVLFQFRNFVILNVIFHLKMFKRKKILVELNNLNINKATQNTDIPTNIIKENSDIFGDFIFSNLNCCINTSSYLPLLKRADITPAQIQKIITDQLVH